MTKEEKMTHALNILQQLNPVRNDSDAYQYALVEWALGNGEKPKPEDFWVDNLTVQDRAILGLGR